MFVFIEVTRFSHHDRDPLQGINTYINLNKVQEFYRLPEDNCTKIIFTGSEQYILVQETPAEIFNKKRIYQNRLF